ncbi:accessory Sec system protein Asp3 [Streptococcus suis]|uniref:Accessory Sec system protein Asp3 n=2 Tax=Streptococcus suis TaxID=1307 RepID=A0A0Z8I328_STRSU|nr:accessory Sec system protein Asp3 [Streptococcus suis]AWL26656.1 accessory Sec system protein Asp3 [Streptococcus suis]AWX96184.1 accessory Sec system protein Asp3 [Streptococcus suis]AWX98182.1 accessory Sec system protein Asp3 [Streptococcus suis]MBO4110193.1 accessory Sec system protein Asp3 [Streptococcus suis]MBS8057270.1 accessory Sec system protein Asp3 [Streptococcus suis]
MEGRLIQKIYWGDTANGGNYLYGSVIDHFDKKVQFENLRFASGKPIKRWHSRTNYQGDRQSPNLPLLRPGYRYRIEHNYSVEPEGRAYIELQYFNRQGEVVGLDILKNGEQEFVYPADAFTYNMALVSAGCQRVYFSDIALYVLDEIDTHYQSRKARGYYSQNRYPQDLEFVTGLIRNTREEEGV